MELVKDQIVSLKAKADTATLKIQTLGAFQLWREETAVSPKDWGRDKTIQLFQFLLTSRKRGSLHKEQIIDRLWEDSDGDSGDRDFKVALHGINKVLEPNRKSRTEAKYVLRQGLTYQLKTEEVWIDSEALETFIALGNQALSNDTELAKIAYQEALALHHGIYLPNRLYEDWSSDERERLQVLTLGAIITLGELMIEENPMEAIRLAQLALQIDNAWEDAYRLEMAAYFQKGNRPMAIKTYRQCERILEEEFGIPPLPETKKLLSKIQETV